MELENIRTRNTKQRGFEMGTKQDDRLGEVAKETRWDRARKVFGRVNSRCNCPSDENYKYYGHRGIKNKFKSAYELVLHIGLPPEGMLLDRIDNDGHYEKGNVRWVDIATSNANRRSWKWSRPQLTPQEVKQVVEYRRRGITRRIVADLVGTSPRNITEIMSGRSWSHLTGIQREGSK